MATRPFTGIIRRWAAYYLYADDLPTPPELIFTENETNNERIFGTPNASPYTKDAFHRYLIDGERGAINPEGSGTKAAALYHLSLTSGETKVLHLRLTHEPNEHPFREFEQYLSASLR